MEVTLLLMAICILLITIRGYISAINKQATLDRLNAMMNAMKALDTRITKLEELIAILEEG